LSQIGDNPKPCLIEWIDGIYLYNGVQTMEHIDSVKKCSAAPNAAWVKLTDTMLWERSQM
jgi:hypothetical protein